MESQFPDNGGVIFRGLSEAKRESYRLMAQIAAGIFAFVFLCDKVAQQIPLFIRHPSFSKDLHIRIYKTTADCILWRVALVKK